MSSRTGISGSSSTSSKSGAGSGTLLNGFHGDPSRGHAFWVYPRYRRLITARWDTHDAAAFCSNASFVRSTGGGVQEYVCRGHAVAAPMTAENLEAKLVQLASMGFHNRTLSAQLLREAHGDLDRAIEALLQRAATDDARSSSSSSSSSATLQRMLPPKMLRQSSATIVDHWTDHADMDLPKEYLAIIQRVAITDQVMGTSAASQTVQMLDAFGKQFDGGLGLTRSFEETVRLAMRASFPALNSASNQNVERFRTSFPALDVSQACVFGGAVRIHLGLASWRRHYLHLALAYLTQSNSSGHLDTTSLQLLMGLMLRGATECQSRKCWVFSEILCACDGAAERAERAMMAAPGNSCLGSSVETSITPFDAAKQRLRAALVKIVDCVKLRAFEVVFIEPTREYFTAVGDHTMAGDVNVHGCNVYLAILMATLGVRLSRMPMLHDPEIKGCADFLSAGGTFNSEYIAARWNPDNFERALGSNVARKVGRTQPRNVFVFGPAKSPVHLANMCLDHSLSTRSQAKRRRLSVYLAAFAKYFEAEFIVERLVNHVLQHTELRKLADLIVREQAAGAGARAHAGFGSYVYDDLDELVPVLCQERAQSFLVDIGILKTPL